MQTVHSIATVTWQHIFDSNQHVRCLGTNCTEQCYGISISTPLLSIQAPPWSNCNKHIIAAVARQHNSLSNQEYLIPVDKFY